ncbi:SRPBCC family protein [Paenibacillus radicis (ex Gao et al. 2016)]|uniref:Activator of Hsp90 ATPase homologue 1/2-like C-terminal domain-containing protein n=1 Tax=Paenibacillus radicis (ex Gao et al. 2016) TaxID=1737354 RepID=A0A917GZ12_9BACL|nr:SRPBCC domain-containing protein [Paenibacillus radicis (ex Gao et al. 2016)]GGG61958.1 hypothetical protein GCM10010918_14450 [Paenibacillus radicis (ex Gao et al. 2016)]
MSNAANQLPDIRQTLVMKAPIERVWKAVATAEGIAAWFMPPVNFEAVIGHEFQLEAGPFGKSPCKVTELDPPNRLSFNWGKDWTLSFQLKETGEKETEFTLVHSGWTTDSVTEFGEAHTLVRERMSGGWDKLVLALQKYVEA